MEHIAERIAKYLTFDEVKEKLSLSESDVEIINKFNERFNGHGVKYLTLDRGLSTAQKIIIKPFLLFPFVLKLDTIEEILKEHKGDLALRYRIPAQNILPFEDCITIGNRGGLFYRYITGGKIEEWVDRLDTYLASPQKESSSEHGTFFENSKHKHLVFDDIFDSILKKCHFLDGEFKMGVADFPLIDHYDYGIEKEKWREICLVYNNLRASAIKIKAPLGIIHGDLHSKNILISKNVEPIVIDFSAVGPGCPFSDYAKLEVHLQFQLELSFTEQFFKKKLYLRSYSKEDLILPRSHHGIAKYIHTIREILWRICLSNTVKMKAEDIDLVYRTHLVFHLSKFCASRRRSKDADNKHVEYAFNEILNLNKFNND